MSEKEDRIKIGPQIGDTDSRLYVRDKGDGTSEFGSIKLIEEGQNMSEGTEIVTFDKIENDGSFVVKDSFKVSEKTSKGPSKVSSNKFRNGWDNIWGGKKEDVN